MCARWWGWCYSVLICDEVSETGGEDEKACEGASDDEDDVQRGQGSAVAAAAEVAVGAAVVIALPEGELQV